MADEFKVKHGIKFPDNTVQVTAATGGASGYSATIGDGSSTTITIAHNLGKSNIISSFKEVASGAYVYPDVVYVNTNSITATFVTAPTTNQYLAAVLGF